MFINIHTHQFHNSNAWSLINLSHDFKSTLPQYNYSMGIHPKFIEASTFENDFDNLKLASRQKNILAIGECGLDRLSEVPLTLQERVFVLHVRWANEIAKPIIIHCVKAFPEVFKILKSCKNNMPVIFHGFNNNINIADQIIKEGYYVSFGKSLLHPNQENIFNHIPSDRFFLENDDSDIAISKIYEQAARIRNTSVEQISSTIQKNLFRIFNNTQF